MLKNGKFIKEEPPKIGQFYVPRFREEEYTPEERFAQSLLLDYQQPQQSLLSKFFGLMLRI